MITGGGGGGGGGGGDDDGDDSSVHVSKRNEHLYGTSRNI
jgi:hypothetical protein